MSWSPIPHRVLQYITPSTAFVHGFLAKAQVLTRTRETTNVTTNSYICIISFRNILLVKAERMYAWDPAIVCEYHSSASLGNLPHPSRCTSASAVPLPSQESGGTSLHDRKRPQLESSHQLTHPLGAPAPPSTKVLPRGRGESSA